MRITIGDDLPNISPFFNKKFFDKLGQNIMEYITENYLDDFEKKFRSNANNSIRYEATDNELVLITDIVKSGINAEMVKKADGTAIVIDEQKTKDVIVDGVGGSSDTEFDPLFKDPETIFAEEFKYLPDAEEFESIINTTIKELMGEQNNAKPTIN